MRVLLQATLERMLAVLSLAATEGAVGFDGQPPAVAGEFFPVVHPGMAENDADLSLEEYFDVSVTLNLRVAYSPFDRHGAEVMTKATTGLYAKAELLRVGLHMDYVLMGYCGGLDRTGGKAYSLPATVNGFVEPLKYRRMLPPRRVGPEWWWAEPNEDALPAGVALQIDFGRARRQQTIESAT